jgi:hypothetical protein
VSHTLGKGKVWSKSGFQRLNPKPADFKPLEMAKTRSSKRRKERNHLGRNLYFQELVTAHATRLFNVAVEVRSEADSNQEQGDAAGGEVAIHLWPSLEKTTGDISRLSKGR